MAFPGHIQFHASERSNRQRLPRVLQRRRPLRVGDLLADDIVIHFPGRNPASGTKRGKEEVMSFFRMMMERAGVGQVPPEVHDVMVGEKGAIALMTRRVAGIDATVAVVYEIQQGKIVEVWPHERDQYAVDEALTAAVTKG